MSLVLGILIGLVLGLTGAGGSILAVPLLMAGLGWSLTQAAPVALLAVAGAAALGSYFAWHRNYVRYRAAALIAMAGVLTAPLGLWLATLLPPDTLALAFAAALSGVALRMLLAARLAPAEAAMVRATVAGDGSRASGPICRLDPQSGRIHWTRPCAVAMSLIGGVTGFLSGLLGVGGGFVIVPSLRAVTELSMQSAIATSLLAIALTSSGTVLGASLMGRGIPWMIAVPFLAGSLLGMGGGRWLAPRIAGPRLQQGFALLMLIVAAGMVAKGLA
ncbi:MAG TPA: sulfite exporter TauE/SafE family protein [Solimonas sp.]|nr:sulfite exporter TauE/SafE family protein [Solimonas sp.]